MGRLFGTDGVRGLAGVELTADLALSLGRAVVATVRDEGLVRGDHVDRPRVAVGRDPRSSGDMLEAALVAGVCAAGGDAVPLGVIPTPGVAYVTTAFGFDSGAVISASHNPVDYNGIKFFGPDGYKLSDAAEDRIEELLATAAREPHVGRVQQQPEAVGAYVDHLVAAADADLAGLKVVVDCANGAASAIAPAVLERLGCDVTAIHASPDGRNINRGCGSTYPDVVSAAVRRHGADVGLAHDGDADRLIAADGEGNVVDGDAILAILARREHERSGLGTVVTTVMTNLGFTHAMRELGIDVVQTTVGDRYVLEAMREGGHPLGGEQSGHLILAHHATTGDGILTAVTLLSAMAASGRPLSELASVMRRLPQVLVNVDGVDRSRLEGAAALWREVAAVEAELADSGRVLVRASGTEPVVRVMVEAGSESEAAAVAERVATAVRAELALEA